jgi:tungstate transport system ATP-binding protein
VTVREAAKAYDGKTLLAVGEITLSAGDLIVLTGDNGSGKTTFLKMLAGLERGDRFGLAFDGLEATAQRYPHELRRTIVYVHQHPYLFNTSIADNIRYGSGSAARRRRSRAPRARGHLGGHEVGPRAQAVPGRRKAAGRARARVLEPTSCSSTIRPRTWMGRRARR